MVTGTGTSAVPGAIDLTNLAWITGDDLLGTIHGLLLARSNRRESWLRVTTSESAGSVGNTALEVCWTWTQARQRAFTALRGPTAIATTATSGFSAAFNIIGKIGAGSRDVGPTSGRALCGGNADARSRAFAGTGTVPNGALGQGACVYCG